MPHDDEKPPGGGFDPASDPDSDIIDLSRRGERHAALRKLMERHGNGVYRFCREQLRDDTRAADVQQKVFLAVYNDLPSFEQRATVRGWLFGIARHRVLDDIKVHNRALSRTSSDDAAEIAEPDLSVIDRIDDARLHEALVACVAELPSETREAVLLRFQQGFTFEEMSKICGEKPGTLQARVKRAMVKLKACVVARIGGAP